MTQRCFLFVVSFNFIIFAESTTIAKPDTTFLAINDSITSDVSFENSSDFPTTKPWSEISSTTPSETFSFTSTESVTSFRSNSVESMTNSENNFLSNSSSDDLEEFLSSETLSATEQLLTATPIKESALSMETTKPFLTKGSEGGSEAQESFTEVKETTTAATESSQVPNFAEFMDNNINFTLSLYNSFVALKRTQENIFFSPLSLFSALLMLHYGAKGTTAEELAHILDINSLSSDMDVIHRIYGDILESILDDPTSKSYVLMANKMFIATGFKILDQYQDGIEEYYNATVQPVNFFEAHTTHLINAWVKSKTDGHISNLFKSVLPPTTAAVILNALYFKGDWQYEFSPTSTVKNVQFRLDRETTANVSMMVNKVKLAYGSSKELGVSILELPYIGDRLSMFVILPEGNKTLEEVEKNINVNSLKNLLRSMKRRVINIRLPKFQLRDTPLIVESLQELGVQKLFSGEADLSGLAEGGFAISDIKHEATIEVSETGSVASAVTGVILERLGSSYEQHFEADRPFMFFIIDKQNGLILFMGRLANPST